MKLIKETLTDGYATQDRQSLSGKFGDVYLISQNMKRLMIPKIKATSGTIHNSEERVSRNNNVNSYEIEHPGEPKDLFMVDRGHKDGKEIHVIKTNAIIEIYNYDKLLTGRSGLITKLIARPQQIRRYYSWCGLSAPNSLLKIAEENEKNGFNNW